MRRTIHKCIFFWNFDKEEKWLNEMAAKGLCLISVGFCKYEFEECEPGEYKICMQMLEKMPSNPESQKYIEFLESTGAEHIASFTRWVYFRKRSADGDFELYSDNESRVKYLTRIISFIALLSVLNLLIGAENLFMAIALESPLNYLGLINLALGIWCVFGTIKLIKKRKRVKVEGQLFE